jgi:hypothetical protein
MVHPTISKPKKKSHRMSLLRTKHQKLKNEGAAVVAHFVLDDLG